MAHWTGPCAALLAIAAVLVAIISPYGPHASNSVPIAPRGLQLPCTALHHSTEIGFMDSVIHSSALHLVLFFTGNQQAQATSLASKLACALHTQHIRVHTAPRLMWDTRARDYRPWGTYYGIDPVANVQLFFGAPQRRFSCTKWFRSRTTINLKEFLPEKHDTIMKWVADTMALTEPDIVSVAPTSVLDMLSTPDTRVTRVLYISDGPVPPAMMSTLRGLACEWRELLWHYAVVPESDIDTVWQRLAGDGHTNHPPQYPLLVVLPVEDNSEAEEVSHVHVLELAREHVEIESFLFASLDVAFTGDPEAALLQMSAERKTKKACALLTMGSCALAAAFVFYRKRAWKDSKLSQQGDKHLHTCSHSECVDSIAAAIAACTTPSSLKSNKHVPSETKNDGDVPMIGAPTIVGAAAAAAALTPIIAHHNNDKHTGVNGKLVPSKSHEQLGTPVVLPATGSLAMTRSASAATTTKAAEESKCVRTTGVALPQQDYLDATRGNGNNGVEIERKRSPSPTLASQTLAQQSQHGHGHGVNGHSHGGNNNGSRPTTPLPLGRVATPIPPLRPEDDAAAAFAAAVAAIEEPVRPATPAPGAVRPPTPVMEPRAPVIAPVAQPQPPVVLPIAAVIPQPQPAPVGNNALVPVARGAPPMPDDLPDLIDALPPPMARLGAAAAAVPGAAPQPGVRQFQVHMQVPPAVAQQMQQGGPVPQALQAMIVAALQAAAPAVAAAVNNNNNNNGNNNGNNNNNNNNGLPMAMPMMIPHAHGHGHGHHHGHGHAHAAPLPLPFAAVGGAAGGFPMAMPAGIPPTMAANNAEFDVTRVLPQPRTAIARAVIAHLSGRAGAPPVCVTSACDDNVDQRRWECGICYSLLVDAVCLPCAASHRFCRHCISRELCRVARCPIDQHPATLSDLRPLDSAVSHLLFADLKVYCPLYHDNGCTWVGPYAKMNHHLDNECEYHPRACSSCDVMVTRSERESHATSCIARPCACPYGCSASIAFNNMDAHKESCPMMPVKCQMATSAGESKDSQLDEITAALKGNGGCGESFPRDQLADHRLKVCPYSLVTCPLTKYGCTAAPMLRQYLVDHARENAGTHVRLLSRVLLHSQAALTRATNAVNKALPLLHERMACSLPPCERKPNPSPSLVYIGSGADNRGAYRYDIDTERWCMLPQLPHAFSLGAITYVDRTIIVAGGQYNRHVIALDTSNPLNTWQTMASLAMPRAGLQLVTCQGHVYAIGGVSSAVGRAVATCERFDLAANTWTTVASMQIPRAFHTACEVNGTIIVTGGRLDANPANPPLMPSAEMYDPSTGLWKNIPGPGLPRSSGTCVMIDGMMIVMGGLIPTLTHGPAHAMDTIEQYNPITKRWSAVPWRLCHRRADLTTCYASNRLWVIGGHSEHASDEVKSFSFATGHWNTSVSLPDRARNGRCLALPPPPPPPPAAVASSITTAPLLPSPIPFPSSSPSMMSFASASSSVTKPVAPTVAAATASAELPPLLPPSILSTTSSSSSNVTRTNVDR